MTDLEFLILSPQIVECWPYGISSGHEWNVSKVFCYMETIRVIQVFLCFIIKIFIAILLQQ